MAAYRSPRSCDSREEHRPAALELGDLAHLDQGPEHEVMNRCRAPRSRRCNGRGTGCSARSSTVRAVFHSPSMSAAKPRTSSIMPQAYGESISPAICFGGAQAVWRRGARPEIPVGRPVCRLPWPGPGRSASGSPARRASRQPARLEVGPADRLEHRSAPRRPTSRGRSASGPSPRSGSRRGSETQSPRSLSRNRCHRSESRACRAVSGMESPSGPSRVRNSASPSSTWPLNRSCVDASRLSSSVSAAVADLGGLRIGLGRLGAPAGVGQRVAQLSATGHPPGVRDPWCSSSAIR